MSEKVITQTSRKFYEQFQFPGDRPIDQDGLVFMRRFCQSVEKQREINNSKKLRVLDAGCGTGNTSVALARRFNDIEFYGVDNSRKSLEKAISASRLHGLTNLHFRKWNLMNPLPYKTRFNIICCLGMLHHTADMEKGLTNLNRVLNDDGIMYLWIYGKYGRYKHSLNMRLLDMLINVEPKSANKIELAKEFVFNADNGSVLPDLLGKTQADSMQKIPLEDHVWIADQFLNPHEILIDMEQLIEISKTSGFKIDHVFGVNEDVSKYFNSVPLYERFKKLNRETQMIALDLLIKPERYFVMLSKTGS